MAKYVYKTKPYIHQVRALKKLLRQQYGGALLMEPRTGKTKVAIDFLSVKYKLREINRALIICPNNVIDVWEEQLSIHCPVPYEVYVWDKKERKTNGIPPPSKNRLLVVLTNYETFQTPGPKIPTKRRTPDGETIYRRSTKRGRIANRNEVRRWAGDKALGILDESHRIKSPGSRAASVIITTQRDFPYRVIMTGTPITKKSRPHDAYQQWKWLNPERFEEWENLGEFKEYFGRWVKVPDIPVALFKGNRHFTELKELMDSDAFSIARDQCFDLPPIDVQEVRVELFRAARVYDDMAERMVSYIRQHTAEASIPLVKVLRLAQITSGHVKTDKGKLIRVGTEKIDATMPIVENCIENGERIIIAARFAPDLDLLYDSVRRLSKRLPIFEIRGGMKRQDVTLDLKKARRIEDPLVYIVQPRAASLGIDMSFCSRMIWYSLTNSYVDFTQCCDRIALSRQSTTFTYMLADGIDRLLYEELQGDGQIARAVIRNPERLFRRGHE